MALRRKWLTVSGFIAIAAAATMLSAFSGASTSQGFSPEQPIHFPHPLHVQTLKMNCLYCHFSANKSPDPGMPAVATCMGCHALVATDKPEIKKLAAYWNKKQPVPWVRMHKVPEYVHFPHMSHVNAGVSCQTCHGPIQNMTQVYQYSSLNMGWCVSCHTGQSNPPFKARYDCAACHY
jgi:c(7)-type cytochrome triheme protein